MPDLYDPINRLARGLNAAFFRRIEVTGQEHIPEDGGGIVVSWHPNGLIDPGLIFSYLPRRVVFGARHGLFNWPGLGWVLKAVGTVPIHRAIDRSRASPEERAASNRSSLDTLAQAVSGGGFACLFPEGDSHDAPHLLELKTGAARFYYRARQLQTRGEPPPVIIPVGLHYDAKQKYRSNALVRFHAPLALPADLDITPPHDEDIEVSRERCRRLTQLIEAALIDVVHVTESWQVHHLMHRGSKLLRAERSRRAGAELPAPDMLERQVGFSRIWAGYRARVEREPEGMQALMQRLGEYDADLVALGIDDNDLDRSPAYARAWRIGLLLSQMVAVFFFLPALLVFGGLINIGPFAVVRLATIVAAKKHKDVATIKVLLGALVYPSAWLVAAYLAARTSELVHATYPIVPATPILAGLTVAALGIFGGMAYLRALRLVRSTLRAVRVRLTRVRRKVALARLRVERDELADALQGLEEGIDLPGSVRADGSVIASETVPPGGRA